MKLLIKHESSFSWKRLLALCLAVLTAGCVWGCGSKDGDSGDPAAVLAETKEWLAEKVAEPAPGPVGGEWTVIALARGGSDDGSRPDDSYFEDYLASADAYVKAADGVLHSRTGYKYTEYARMILGVTAAGGDPRDVGGYNLLEALTDMDNVQRQGTNGPIWTLIAYDCGGYEIPKMAGGQKQTSREALIQAILDLQQEDGGWSLDGGASDPDMTAMALTALAPYDTGKGGRPEEVGEETLAAAAKAVERGIGCLSALQQEDGGYAGMDSGASESCSQAVTALSALGIDCASDERFVKGETSLLDALLGYRAEDGGFCHSADLAESDLMATEQACYALAAYARFQKGEKALFDMTA